MADRPLVLVTGSTSGIGRATARRLADDGAQVVVTGRTPERVAAAVGELGGDARGVVADLFTAHGTATVVDALDNLDAVVLSHGGDQVPGIFREADPDRFGGLAEAMFLTNARLVHGLLPLLAAGPGRPDGGRIVLVTSDGGRAPTIGEVMIGALAAANLMFVRTLAREAARDRVRVHAVTVSLTEDTETYDRVLGASDFSRRLFEKAAARMPFGPVRAADVAGEIVHLLGPETAATTGQVVPVNGGLTT
jgi:3-oxoacyl-[acyl-carrier protein] reductase